MSTERTPIKATALIAKLIDLVSEHGDVDVYVRPEYNLFVVHPLLGVQAERLGTPRPPASLREDHGEGPIVTLLMI